MHLISGFLSLVLWLFLVVLTIRAILSLVPLLVRGWQPRGPLLVIADFVDTVTDPPLRLCRRLAPPLRVWGSSWDLGFVLLYLSVWLLQNLAGALPV